MISPKDRQMAINSITEATEQGASQQAACAILKISVRTLQNWRKKADLVDARTTVEKSASNKLSAEEIEAIIRCCNEPEHAKLSPHQIVPKLLDEKRYLGSVSTFYRVLKEAKQLEHRQKSAKPVVRKKPKSYVATGPNQVWSWDITYLGSAVKGQFYFLYLFMDIYSRKIVGWEVYETQTAEQASEVLTKIKLAEKLGIDHDLVLHSDNGGPMKGATMLATMQCLGIIPSYSRPRVSDDNPFSESLFKHLKYSSSYPLSGAFASLEEARNWVLEFTTWYNTAHLHSKIQYVTPEQRHTGLDKAILIKRHCMMEQARSEYPSRWSCRKTRNWCHQGEVSLNPSKEAKNMTLNRDSEVKLRA